MVPGRIQIQVVSLISCLRAMHHWLISRAAARTLASVSVTLTNPHKISICFVRFSTALLITNTGLSNTMDIYNSGGPEVSIRSLKKDSMKFVLTNTDLRHHMQDFEADAELSHIPLSP